MTEDNSTTAVADTPRKPSPTPRVRDEHEEPETVPQADEPADEPEVRPGKSAAPRYRRWLPAAVAAAVLIALAVADVLLWQRADDADAVAQAQTAALAAAQQDVPAVLSYDYRSLDGYPALAKGKTTGEFQDTLGRLIQQSVLPAAKAQQIVTKTEVAAASVASAGRGEAVVLAFINQTTTSTKLAQPKLEGSRVRVTMRQSGGDWLISQLQPV